MSRQDSVSVVVNVFNEERNIEAFLDCLVAQSSKDFEVVLVDDGSTDSTMELASRYTSRLNLSLHRRPHLGLKAARASGIAESNGEICITLDADQVLPEDCVEKFVEAFRDKSVGAVGARRVSWGEGWIVTGRRVMTEATWRLRRNAAGELRWATGGACAYRKSALGEVGGLTTQGHTAADVDISWRLEKAGWRVVARDDIVIEHRDPSTLGELWHWSQLQGENMSGTLIAHPEQMANWRFWTRFYPLVVAAALLVRPPLGLLGAGATIAWSQIQLRGVSDRIVDRSLAWVVLTIQNIAWSVGLTGALLRQARAVIRR